MRDSEKAREACRRWREKNRERQRAYSRQWAKDNPEKVRAKNSASQKRNRKKVNEKNRRRYANNPESFKARTDRWIARNPEKKRTQCRNRRARLRGALGSHTGDDIVALLKQQRHRCANPACRISLRRGYDVDHVLPLTLRGSNDISNIQLLCAPCNRSKQGKHPETWSRENGFLL